MSTEEEQIKAAIVVFPEAIGMASPELNNAIEIACEQLNKFVDYLQTLDPELERHEATVLGGAILQGLPMLFEDNPEIIAGIKADCQKIRANRP
ncbi:hypothetical protein [Nostoc sp.]|uniref:hypothetical protein n=1 Tax=Nostoc sp. TaxID=1180 RepID=UPI002FFB8389